MLSACSTMPSLDWPSDDLQTPLEFFAVATVEPAHREAMWRTLRSRPDSPDKAVKTALLQSLPGHSGYDAGVARQRLSAISYSEDGEAAALARIRLAELAGGSGRADADCRAEVRDLQQRLDAIVDIERSLDRHGNAPSANPSR